MAIHITHRVIYSQTNIGVILKRFGTKKELNLDHIFLFH